MVSLAFGGLRLLIFVRKTQCSGREKQMDIRASMSEWETREGRERGRGVACLWEPGWE